MTKTIINFVLLIGWVLIGCLNLCSKREISKFSYFAVWSIVVLHSILSLLTQS